MHKECPICLNIILKGSKQWERQIYCSVKCRKSAHRKASSSNKRIEQRRANMRQNEEVLQLVRQCRRAKTVQILEGHDANSLITTMALVRNRPKFDVNLCHISPVKNKNSIGLFHYKNLFYGGSHQNKKLGNKCFGGGLSIYKENLVEQWEVSENLSTNDILIKIELYLGNIIEEYLKLSSVRKSKKTQISNKICTVDTSACFEDLIQTSHKVLTEKWYALSKQTSFKIQKIKSESKYINYIDELTRFISYKDGNQSHLKKVRELMIIGYVSLSKVSESTTYNKDMLTKYSRLIETHHKSKMRSKKEWSKLKDFMYETAFHTLQGEKIPLSQLRTSMSKYIVPGI